MPGGDLYYNGPFVSTPLSVNNTPTKPWKVTIYDGYLTIGCQRHTYQEWYEFTDIEINQMHKKALEWWNKNKHNVFALLTSMELWPLADENWHDDWL